MSVLRHANDSVSSAETDVDLGAWFVLHRDKTSGRRAPVSRSAFGDPQQFPTPSDARDLASNSLLTPAGMLSVTMSAPAQILFADDNSVDQSTILRVIRTLGYAADAVANGKSALAAWQTGRYGLILVDCQTPIAGFSTSREIRRLKSGRSHIPIVGLVTDAATGVAADCETAGIDELLTLPLDPALLQTCLAKWLDGNTAPIDWKALLDGLDGDEDFVRQLIILFVEDGRNSLQQIAAAVRAEDYVALSAKAHSLKGSTANLLAEKARYAAEKLEYAAKESNTDQIPQLATEVQYELQRAMDYLNGRMK